MALSGLPLASGMRHKEVFENLGWVVRNEGNHIVLTHTNRPGVFLSIPNHKQVKKETLKAIIRAAGITDEQYAVFFHVGESQPTELAASAEAQFRETRESDGRTRVHCMACCEQVCLSSDPGEISSAKGGHLAECSGPLKA